MTRILVQRGSTGSSSSSSNRSSLPASSSSSSAPPPPPNVHSATIVRDEDLGHEMQEHCALDDGLEPCGNGDSKAALSDDLNVEAQADKVDVPCDPTVGIQHVGNDKVGGSGDLTRGMSAMRVSDRPVVEKEGPSSYPVQIVSGNSYPPPPPAPPPKPSLANPNTSRFKRETSNTLRNVSSRRTVAWPVVSTRSSPSGSRPSSPRLHGDGEGYNSADEQNSCLGSSYDDAERERQFEIDIRRTKGLEVKRMLEDGNCLFRAVADQVYGDSEAYDLTRQMCIDYMERERDHFSQFITEGFTSYCKRKRRDKVYGNNVEIQALSEMYNRPIHIYSYSTDPINIFHRSYGTDTPPIRLSYHHGNHYNSLVDPRRLTVGAGLGFSSLRGRDIDKDQVKAAIRAQQEQQIDNALLAEGRFFSDLELTEKEIERMVMEASRVDYFCGEKYKQQIDCEESSTSNSEPSSSGARASMTGRELGLPDAVLSNSMQILLSMGFSYLQVSEAYSIFGDDIDSMICYLLETSSASSRCKGKAAE